MEIHIFGSICRGELDEFSDVDILLIKDEEKKATDYDLNKYSIYDRDRLQDLWCEGNPFAWHLYSESKMVFSSDGGNSIKDFGRPAPYANLEQDLNKFYTLFLSSRDSLISTPFSIDFDLSMIFLAVRNYATCYSLGFLKECNFSRRSALKLGKDSVGISKGVFVILEKSRILSTRGVGDTVNKNDLQKVLDELDSLQEWFVSLLNNLKK